MSGVRGLKTWALASSSWYSNNFVSLKFCPTILLEIFYFQLFHNIFASERCAFLHKTFTHSHLAVRIIKKKLHICRYCSVYSSAYCIRNIISICFRLESTDADGTEASRFRTERTQDKTYIIHRTGRVQAGAGQEVRAGRKECRTELGAAKIFVCVFSRNFNIQRNFPLISRHHENQNQNLGEFFWYRSSSMWFSFNDKIIYFWWGTNVFHLIKKTKRYNESRETVPLRLPPHTL